MLSKLPNRREKQCDFFNIHLLKIIMTGCGICVRDAKGSATAGASPEAKGRGGRGESVARSSPTQNEWNELLGERPTKNLLTRKPLEPTFHYGNFVPCSVT
jgi:hypothetical protein